MSSCEMKAEDDPLVADSGVVDPFADKLARHGLVLRRGCTRTLQINLGLLCNQTCRHCHLVAGPDRQEIMSRTTMEQVIEFARPSQFECLDLTGGAPEMNPHIEYLLSQLAPLAPRLMLRSNLTALAAGNQDNLLDICRQHKVVIITSLPATNGAQTDAMRGRGTMETSIRMLARLNALGYGRQGTGLELDLVANPPGAYLPAAQGQAEIKFRRDLENKWGIVFSHLYTFANVPLGRFRKWLKESGNLPAYMERLVSSFNPATIDGLMCRTSVSISWDGYLYDCDFNLAAGLPQGKCRQHISEIKVPPAPGDAIATGDYCYACTAGSGFT
jgi:radical SAM/Cys-rich protein